MTYRHTAGFGKRIKFFVIGRTIKEGLDLYIPLVDDNAIDCVVRREDKSFVEVQIKARSKDVKFGDGALFAAIPHEYRENYWFIFYSEHLNTTLILSSKEFIKESNQNKKGRNAGLRSIWFNGTKTKEEYIKSRFTKYIVSDFSRILKENPDKSEPI